MARAGAARRNFVQKPQLAPVLDRERAHGARLLPVERAHLLHGIEAFVLGIHRQERRAGRFCHQTYWREFSSARIKTVGINALALAACICADVGDVFAPATWPRPSGREWKGGECRGKCGFKDKRTASGFHPFYNIASEGPNATRCNLRNSI